MARVVYLGGEATAAGFRLAGLDARTTAPGDADEQLRIALAERPDCVLLDGTLTEFVPQALLEHAMTGDDTLFAIVPDVRGRGAPPALGRLVRTALGIDA
jgi:vacuolar-type H+-ATPase subunit F/Vma7